MSVFTQYVDVLDLGVLTKVNEVEFVNCSWERFLTYIQNCYINSKINLSVSNHAKMTEQILIKLVRG